jgi:hypothetical protein
MKELNVKAHRLPFTSARVITCGTIKSCHVHAKCISFIPNMAIFHYIAVPNMVIIPYMVEAGEAPEWPTAVQSGVQLHGSTLD